MNNNAVAEDIRTSDRWKQNFFTIWTGQAVSKFTSSVLQFAIVWYLTDKTGSAGVLTLAMFMGFFPQAMLGPLAGVMIDRFDRKKIMILSDVLIAAVSFGLVAAGWMGHLSTGLILFILFLRSVGTAFHAPCMEAATPQIVPEQELTRCAGYSQALTSISDIFSPAAAAVLYQYWRLENIVMLDVIGAGIAAVTLMIAVIPKHESKRKMERIRVFGEAMEGFKVLQKNKGVYGLVMISCLYTIGMMPISALFPLMSMSYFGGSSTQASIVEIVFSIGFMIGSVLLSVWGGTKNRVYTIVLSYLMMSSSLLITANLSVEGYWIFVLCAWIMGVSGPFYWGMFTPILQSHFQNEYLGRVMSLTGSLRYFCGPMALILSGVLSELWGAKFWFWIAGMLTLSAAILIVTVPVIRNCDVSGAVQTVDGE